MVPILLLLLLHESLAEQADVDIHDHVNKTAHCKKQGLSCVILCESRNGTWFNESHVCLEAELTTFSTFSEYNIYNYSTCKDFVCEYLPILSLIQSLQHDRAGQKDLMQLISIREACEQLLSSDVKLKKAFLSVEKHIIHAIMNRTKVEAGSYVNFDMRALSLNVFNISEGVLNSAGADSSIHIEAPQLLAENETSVEVWLPVYALLNIPEMKRIIGLVTYLEHSQFQFHQEEIASRVLRIELLEERRLHNLTQPIKMSFEVTKIDSESQLLCHYFDEVSDWRWKTDGCETDNSTYNDQQDKKIICSSDHATPFAVLLIRESISSVHWEILSYISYIGCGLSAFFTALSLVIYVFSRNHKLDYSISIHVSLSGALFLLNTTFLLTEWGATVDLDWVCVFIAVSLHYSLLCCFTWMAIEALHLYLLLIKVFNTYYKHYMLKLSLAGWGIPGVIVAVSLGVKNYKQFYGATQMTMTDTNQTNTICWITDDSFFYSLNLVYFSLIFIFNTGILMAVASSICKMKQVYKSNSKLGAGAKGKSWSDSQRFSASCRSGLTLMGLTCLMGTTWGLAFLGSGYVNYPILYLFCILNSAQGCFIFLWICLSVKKQRKREMEDKMSSTPVRTSGTKSE